MAKTFREWNVEQSWLLPPSVKLGHVALDGTTLDTQEDRQHGRERRGDELPEWVADKQRRIAKIREAKAALEAEAKAAGKAAVDPKAQRNFTDPESRIMHKSGKEYVQAYNAQAAVDSKAQVIVACSLSNQPTDIQQLAPMLKLIKRNTGRQAQELSADAGYCSEGNLAVLARHHIDAYIATGRHRHGERTPGRGRGRGTRVAQMHAPRRRASAARALPSVGCKRLLAAIRKDLGFQ